MTTHLPPHRTTDDVTDIARRRAVVGAMGRAPSLIRYALRYSISLADAEDAYQRAMELALTKAPQVDDEEFMAWLYTVVRNEAIRIRGGYRYEQPHGDDLIDMVGSTDSRGDTGPDATYAWKERYRTVQDALSGLTQSQRTCLMLRSAGASHPEIEEITGFSARKIERSILEGRRRLREFELRVDTGAECPPMSALMMRVLDAEATPDERQRLSLHVRHCGGCRAEFRGRREQARILSSFVPGMLLAPATLTPSASDPSAALGWWERITQGTQFRVGQATQVWLDLPALMATKLGAGAVAVAVAGAIGTPMVVDAVRTDAPASQVRAVSVSATPVTPAPTVTRETLTAGARVVDSGTKVSATRKVTAAKKKRQASAGATKAAGATTQRRTSSTRSGSTASAPPTTRTAPSSGSGGGSAEMEFSP